MLRVVLGIVLTVVVAGRTADRKPLLDEPSRAVEAFLKLDTEGAQFTEAGWQHVAALVSEPGPRTVQPASVYEDWFVIGTAPGATADRAEVWAEGRVFGKYDPRTGLYHTDGDTGPMKFRQPLQAVRVGGRWKLKGPMPAPGVAWQAVLRHATGLRDTTTDPKIKRRAALAVNALTRWHPKPANP